MHVKKIETRHRNYIALEGMDGAGKSDLMKVIRDFLSQNNVEYVDVREPGGTPLAEKLRAHLKDKNSEPISDFSEFLIFSAARMQLLENVVQPALHAGKLVLSDRCFVSTEANQGIDMHAINDAMSGKLLPVMPGLIIYLSIDLQTSLSRVGNRGKGQDRFEQKGAAVYELARSRYEDYCERNGSVCVIIDAKRPFHEVKESVLAALEAYLFRND